MGPFTFLMDCKVMTFFCLMVVLLLDFLYVFVKILFVCLWDFLDWKIEVGDWMICGVLQASSFEFLWDDFGSGFQ